MAVHDSVAQLYGLAARLDRIRCALLRVSMRASLARAAMSDRSLRLGILFGAAAAVVLPVACLWPLWVLAIGPVLSGIPHLIATARYVPRALEAQNSARRSVVFALVAAAALRLWLGSAHEGALSEWILGGNTLELAAMALLALTLAWTGAARLGSPGIAGVVLAPLVYASWVAPAATAGAMILIHNFVGFGYWIRACRTPRDRGVAATALAAFAVAHAAIFTGALDGLIALGAIRDALSFANLSLDQVGSSIFPWSTDGRLLIRGVVAYAFGQSLHYVVWLRMIPDQELYRPVPVGFRKSLSLLIDDFGRWGVLAIALLGAAAVCVFLLVSYPEARTLYFCAAAFHGYAEIAGLSASVARAGAARL